MEWKEAVELYSEHKARMVHGKKSEEIERKTKSDLESLLAKLGKLQSCTVDEVTTDLLNSALGRYKAKYKMMGLQDIMEKAGQYEERIAELLRCLVFARYRFACAYCGRSAIAKTDLPLELEDKSRGSRSSSSLDKLACACRFCISAPKIKKRN